MPYYTHEKVDPKKLLNTGYGFFTNEKGTSSGGYVVSGELTRNINIASPQDPTKDGYDPASHVVDNLMACFHELSAEAARAHKFVMSSNYGKGGARVLSCQNAVELNALKSMCATELSSLGLHTDMTKLLGAREINIIKADALVFKGIPDELIMAGGASGDAHPIILMDDANKVCAYVSGPHAAIKEGVLEKTIVKMQEMGANLRNIQLVIGPGLGKRSYEFGSNAADYLNVPTDKVDSVRDPQKRLLDIGKIIRFKAMGYLDRKQIHNMDLNTMAFDLYDELGNRKTEVDFRALTKEGPLFFSARREVMSRKGITQEDAGLHNTTGRHFAGMVVRG